MIQIKYNSDFILINSIWTLIFKTIVYSYFQSPLWHKIVLALLKQKHLTRKTHKLIYFQATVNNGKADHVVIGFFYIKKIFNKRTLLFSHLVGPSDYFDFISTAAVDAEFLNNTILQIATDHKCTELQFAHIKKKSLLFEAIALFDNFNYSSLKCVAISLENNYEQHLSKLSKNAKQNLRTANNRLTKSGLSKEIIFLSNKDANEIDFIVLKTIYLQRSIHKKQPISVKSKIYKLVDHLFQKEKDLFDLQEIKETDFVLGVLKIEGKIAAYFFGLKNTDGIEINRVAIDEQFKYYSPGIILLDQLIKDSFAEGLKIIDLTVGDEKYKYDLGGQTHEIFNINGTICLD